MFWLGFILGALLLGGIGATAGWVLWNRKAQVVGSAARIREEAGKRGIVQ